MGKVKGENWRVKRKKNIRGENQEENNYKNYDKNISSRHFNNNKKKTIIKTHALSFFVNISKNPTTTTKQS